MCRCPDGVERPVELDPATCDKNTQEIINSNGHLICSDMSVTRVEAARRAVERLKQREAEELERISNEMKDEAKKRGDKENEHENDEETSESTTAARTKKKKKKTKQQREQDQLQRETIGRFIKRSTNEETRAAKAPYESLEVERTGEWNDLFLNLLYHNIYYVRLSYIDAHHGTFYFCCGCGAWP